ncbi:lysozyme inhibitor LprI family protein [Rhizobium sp. X9]|uniref:lysozyme inhibitor LprI family protein n=1 Tax=Rhizobium sp. X9 TaxID=2815360 RepID=UPI001C0DAD91|nr:lysozyme inhibitor LprI family protein [Rhizobium sp. X9]
MHLKRTLLASSIILAFSALVSPASAASFDCTKPDLAADEKAICDNRALNDQDVKMATTFDILTQLMAMGARDTLRDEQSQWLKRRQECAADVACLTGAYEEHMNKLGEAFQSINRPL